MSKKSLPLYDKMEELKKFAEELGISVVAYHVRPSFNSFGAVGYNEIVIEGVENDIGNRSIPNVAPRMKYYNPVKPEALPCDCGAEATGSNAHSSWCSKKEGVA